MEIIIKTEVLKEYSISPTMYCILFYTYEKQNLDFIYDETDLTYLENEGFIKLVGEESTIFLREKALKIFKKEEVGFSSFWTTYPRKVGVGTNQRILRSEDLDSKQAKLSKIKYDKILEETGKGTEFKIIQGLKKELTIRRKSNSLAYMQNIETYLNQRTWEKYYDLDINIETGSDNSVVERVEGI